MSESYLKELVLPSKGLFYGDRVPDGLVTLVPLGTTEEKLFASGASSGSRVIDKIFDACVKLPIPHEELVLGDRLFILLQLRAISYGDDYSYPFKCTECGKKSWGTIHIPSIKVREAAPDATGKFTLTLPILGYTLEVRLLTGTDEKKIEKYIDNLSAKSRGSATDVEYIYRLARRIEKIDDKDVGIREAMELVEKLKGKDSLHLRDVLEENDVGPDLTVEPNCQHCGYPNGPMQMPFDKEFFRPRKRSTGAEDHIGAAEALDAPR